MGEERENTPLKFFGADFADDSNTKSFEILSPIPNLDEIENSDLPIDKFLKEFKILEDKE